MKTILRFGLPTALGLGVVLAIIYWPKGGASVQTAASEWTCSMHPQIRQPKPGKCPICGMGLVPISQASQEKERIEKRAGVLTEPIAYRDLSKELRTVGKLDYSERQTAYITARIAGRAERVYADFTGIQVKKDDHLLDIYSPDLNIGQAELINSLEAYERAKRNDPEGFKKGFAASTLESARMKLRLLGITPKQLEQIEKTRITTTNLTIYAPMGGTVVEKNIRPGQYVKEGDMLYRIADLDPIWLYLDIYEYDLSWVRIGQKVAVAVEAYPGVSFPGTVMFIDPFLEDKTRTVKARVNLPNPERKLKPAMYASVTLRVRLRGDGTPEPTGLEGKYLCPMHPEVVKDKPGKCPICEMPLERVPNGKAARVTGHEHDATSHPPVVGKVLAIRASAVLDTGRRQITYRRTKEGAFELVELRLGPRAEGTDDKGASTSYYPVLSGLKENDAVVMQGGFLLDSQRQIEGMPSLLFPEGLSGVDLHAGHGAPAKTEHKH